MVLALDILLLRAKQHAQRIKRAKRHALRQRSLTVTFDMPEWKKRNYPLVRASPRPRNPNATGYAKYRRGYENSPWALEYLHDHLDPASLQGTEFRRKFQVPRCIFDGIVADTRNSGVLPDELIKKRGSPPLPLMLKVASVLRILTLGASANSIEEASGHAAGVQLVPRPFFLFPSASSVSTTSSFCTTSSTSLVTALVMGALFSSAVDIIQEVVRSSVVAPWPALMFAPFI